MAGASFHSNVNAISVELKANKWDKYVRILVVIVRRNSVSASELQNNINQALVVEILALLKGMSLLERKI